MAYTISSTTLNGTLLPTGSITTATTSLPNITWATAQNNSQTSLVVTGKSSFKDDVEINGSLSVNGIPLSERLDKIEQRLCIMRPNKELESRWEQLKSLGDQYRELEQEIKEKEEIIRILKT